MTHPVDVHVGKPVRQRRWLAGMTQQQLAEKVGIKFQQIQKYEKGTNRIGSGRLFRLADFFDVDVTYFFEGAEYILHPGLEVAGIEQRMDRQETKELVYAYYSITDPRIRRKVVAIAKLLI